jgi:recomb_XerD: tyrosine recombinase XerD
MPFWCAMGPWPKTRRRRCACPKRQIACRNTFRWRTSRHCWIKTFPRARWDCAITPSWKCFTVAACAWVSWLGSMWAISISMTGLSWCAVRAPRSVWPRWWEARRVPWHTI